MRSVLESSVQLVRVAELVVRPKLSNTQALCKIFRTSFICKKFCQVVDLYRKEFIFCKHNLCRRAYLGCHGSEWRRIKGNLFEYLSWVGPVTSDHRKTTKPEAHKASKSTMNDSGQIAEK